MPEPLDTRQLRAFVTLARRGSFTLAAKDLSLSQSAVSHSMRALENDIGCRLFDRMSKKVALTQAGEQLLEHATRILDEMNTAREAITHLSKWGRTRLRICASTSVCQYILPKVLRQFQQQYPGASVIIQAGDTPAAMDLLRSNSVDLAFTLDPGFADEFEFKPLFTDEMHFITSPAHRWAAARHVVREEIPTQPYVLYQRGTYTSRLVEEYFRTDDMVLNTVMELGSMEAIKEMVMLGLGISIVAPWIARRELESGSLVELPLGRRKLKRTWGITHVRSRRLAMAEETFVKLCAAAVQAGSDGATRNGD